MASEEPLPGVSDEEEPATSFRGRLPRGRPSPVDDAASDRLEGRWFTTSRYRRRARATEVTPLTTTGTVKVSCRVVDGEPFVFKPGQFIGIEHEVKAFGYRRSPYCILSPPHDEPVFDLLIRMVPDGPLSQFLGTLEIGEEFRFRGPTGHSMLAHDDGDLDLVLLATGTGLAPLYSLASYLLSRGFSRSISLWWGLRLADDICFTDELDELAASHPNFRYEISLSQPPPGWTGLRGRITESVPPLLETVGGKRYYLSGNGAMTEEMALALSDMGVVTTFIYQEPFFNGKHHPDPETMAAIRSRFVAHDLPSPYATQRQPGPEPVAPGDPQGEGRRLSASEVYERMPALLTPPPD